MQWYAFPEGRVGTGHAWTAAEVRREIEAAFAELGDGLPPADADVLLKPNLNNDLHALVGNSTDLRLLAGLLGVLRDRGHARVTIADGSNVGMERRGIDGFARLRVDRLARRYGARLVDLNRSEGVDVELAVGRTRIAREVLEAPFLIAAPKLKTHAVAGLSLATKLWMGAVVGQRKRDVHRDLPRNLAALAAHVRPHLVLLDALVGMEGNGPGDGTPFRMDMLVAGTDMYLTDLAVARLVDVPWRDVPHMLHAERQGHFAGDLPDRVAEALPVRRRIEPAPRRSVLADLSEARLLSPLKRAVRPFVDHPLVANTAYSLGVIQDRYQSEDDDISSFFRREGRCTRCGLCESVCPMQIPWEDIGAREQGQGCLQCLSCFWICPTEAIALMGRMGYLGAHVRRHKARVGRL